MLILFKLIALTVMIVMALKIVMIEGMLLEKLGKYFERKVKGGHKIYDLFICPWCANTIQVFTAHAFAFGLGILPFEFNWQLIVRLPLVIFGASFISGNLWNLYLTTNSIRDRNEAQENYYNIRVEEIIDSIDDGVDDGFDDDEDKKKGYFEAINN